VLLTSHYMGDVTALADRVLVIDSGRLRFVGDLRVDGLRVAGAPLAVRTGADGTPLDVSTDADVEVVVR
jgi:ABC-type multidrug transport system ATPase subunit